MTSVAAVAGVLITVPHGTCSSKDLSMNDFCDSTAADAATLLASVVDPSVVEFYVSVFESNLPHMDMDTMAARDAKFRTDLTNKAFAFKEKYGDSVILLDIHSFDPSERVEWADSEVVIVETRTLHDALESVGLSYYLNNNGVAVKVVVGTEVDIVQEMDAMGIKNIAIEFNQNLSSVRLGEIVSLIAQWLLKPKGSVPTSGVRTGSYRHANGWGGRGYHGGGGWGGSGFSAGLGILGGLALGTALSASYARPYYYPPPAYGYGYPYGYGAYGGYGSYGAYSGYPVYPYYY